VYHQASKLVGGCISNLLSASTMSGAGLEASASLDDVTSSIRSRQQSGFEQNFQFLTRAELAIINRNPSSFSR